MRRFRFGLETREAPEPWKVYENHRDFLEALPALLEELKPVTDHEAALATLREDREIFPVRQRLSREEVEDRIRTTILDDLAFAVEELSQQATLVVEVNPYHALGSGLQIKSKIHTGEAETGHILWLQITLRLNDREYAWWSHD